MFDEVPGQHREPPLLPFLTLLSGVVFFSLTHLHDYPGPTKRVNDHIRTSSFDGLAGALAHLNVPLSMQVAISLILLFAALYVILSKRYDARDKHWAYGTIGLVSGFWLKA